LRYSYHPEEIERKLSDLRRVIGDDIRIYRGCDFHLHYDNLLDALANPTKYTINGNRYLLVEFDDRIISHNTADLLGRLHAAGMIPVITHPERNPVLRKRLKDLADWVASGALVQVTAQSLLGQFGESARDAANQLMKLGLVHFVASDAHDIKHRPPSLREGYEWVRKHYGDPTANALFIENPRAALSGADLPPEGVVRRKPARRWLSFHR
jgi:protein-tyrosine phosphatase